MSLDFQLNAITNWKEVCFVEVDGRRQIAPATQALIFSTMAVGIGHLTTERLDEFHWRLQVWEKLHGFELTPREVVIQHIGLRTNVSYETHSKWRKRTLDNSWADYCWARRKAAEQQAS